MIWLMKHWKPALATALLLALIAAWQADRRTQYQRGQADKAAKISLTLAEAANKQAAAAREKERRAAAELPLEHIVLETDSPYMSEGGTPADISRIAEIVCCLRGIGLPELSAATERNVDELLAFSSAV